MRATFMSATFLTVALATSAVAAPAQAAEPVEISCGATLTTDAYLSTDLVCTEGLTVRANLTLDLRGHRLSGPSMEVPSAAASAISIRGGAAVTIRNGRIDHWGTAVSTGPYPSDPEAEPQDNLRVSVQQVAFEHNTVGLKADFFGNPLTVTFDVNRSRFERNWLGIDSNDAGSVLVTNTVFVNNVSAGIHAYGRSGVTLTDSRISGGTRGLDCNSYCTVTRSRLERSRTAISISEAPVTIEDSVLSANGTGLKIISFASVSLTRTTVKANKTGVFVGQYIVFTSSQSAFTGNEMAITSRRPDPTNTLNYNVSLSENLLSRNEDGVFLRRDSESGLELQGNLATHNTRYGIYAPGAADLGGNAEVGNGRACVGVVCGTP